MYIQSIVVPIIMYGSRVGKKAGLERLVYQRIVVVIIISVQTCLLQILVCFSQSPTVLSGL